MTDLGKGDEHFHADAHDRRGLTEIINAFEGESNGAVEVGVSGGGAGGVGGGHKKEKGATTVFVTNTIQAAGIGSGRNGTGIANEEKTVTVIKTELAAAAASGNAYVLCDVLFCSTDFIRNFQLSFVTETVFRTGAAPTITVTPLPETITQQLTITVTAPAAVVAPAAAMAPQASDPVPAASSTSPQAESVPSAAASMVQPSGQYP